jgi:hypothetical protein
MIKISRLLDVPSNPGEENAASFRGKGFSQRLEFDELWFD